MTSSSNPTIRSYLPVLLLLLFMWTSPAIGQEGITYISGTVTDESTGDTMPGVNVYLSGTTIGVSTDTDGRYSLRTDKKGSYDLVFSIIGYEKKVIPIELLPPSQSYHTLSFNVAIKLKGYELGSLEVRSSNEEWKKNYALFEQEFLGQTDFARETEVTNPWVMDFHEGDQAGYLAATSTEPLHLVNHALGYEVFVEVGEFNWARTGSAGYYLAYPRFVPMEAERNRDRRRWERNRKETWDGSLRHFLQSLYNGTLSGNQFTVVSLQDMVPMSAGQVRFELMGREDASRELAGIMKGFRLLRDIRVDHGRIGDVGTVSYGSDGGLNLTSSVVSPARESRTFLVDPLGNLLDPNSLTLQGDWAQDRMADTLPLDYDAGI